MTREASDELRDIVLKALRKTRGNREEAAEMLGKSVRTLNRYIHDLNLFAQMEREGLIKKAGPPRNVDRGTSMRKAAIVKYIHDNGGEIDYGELTVLIYGEDNQTFRQRLYSALSELKGKGVIASDGVSWFVVKPG